MLLFELLNVDYKDFYRYIDEGWVSERMYPDDPNLRIYNYTPKTQYEKYWTPVTLACRGLIVRWPSGEVVARPFRKFFNYGEYDLPEEVIFNEPVVVTDKIDGSLGISYINSKSEFSVATRGSFVSEQALMGNNILWNKYGNRDRDRGLTDWYINSEITYLFEIVYPENKIVVDYGDTEDLFLLGGIVTETGAFLSPESLPEWPGPRTETFSYKTFKEALEAPPRPGKEGLVVRWPTLGDYMLKLKQEDYVSIHRIVTNMSDRKLWELAAYNDVKDERFNLTHKELCKALRLNPDEEYPAPDDIIGKLPEGLRREFDEKIQSFYREINMIIDDANDFVSENRNRPRKDFALEAKAVLKGDANIAFLILDGRFDKSLPTAWLNVRP